MLGELDRLYSETLAVRYQIPWILHMEDGSIASGVVRLCIALADFFWEEGCPVVPQGFEDVILSGYFLFLFGLMPLQM